VDDCGHWRERACAIDHSRAASASAEPSIPTTIPPIATSPSMSVPRADDGPGFASGDQGPLVRVLE